ncbi:MULTISPECIES: SDR family NAD(P)-dependent oxidoreductase [Priestia]|uniref:SDR family NAD(P)-dependent oxidoreductase n=1 Tax=Priestia TaxID=2800373 RepID=UPI000490DA98|nr:SDR family oxidoreductase [Priestia megaterium]MCM3151750.1 SDR family oxidoreductase [Priestia megaterium]MCP1451371.1 3-oxoacyl-[acyl-carrier protein] reductase [Priestia megaterium]MCU7739341.1 SDR family oxidoreductase [Priestia megaterium]MCU7744725.1 SDR family oxidoreductase [Priestia megaterium]MDC7770566.1 SDR family NAD(P)-dependent oxidoreductase [Priestia megaterium]
MDLQLQNKNVLITGGSKGIGKAIAASFIQEGANVGIAARGEEALQDAQSKLENVRTYTADLTNESDRVALIEKFIKDFGSIDILINNAGGSNGSKAMETDLSLFKEAMELNYFSAVHLSKLAAARMTKDAAIVNVTSIFGRESGGKVTYNNAKAALISFTKSFADEMISKGIRVNGVAPGSILHETGNWKKRMDENPEKIKQFVENEIPAGRFGEPEEVANAVVFLASSQASWIVGATLNVDGGQSKMNF